MAVTDIELFLRERLQALDPSRSVDPGSEVDLAVVQPLLQRIGLDPFTVDVRAFLLDRLNQKFPDMPTGDQDAISEMLILPMTLFLTPLVREIQRMRQNQSLKNPTLLNMEEAESLGGNFFVERPQGERATVTARIYYSQPRAVRATAANIFTTASGLGFVPKTTQSISADQMLFNAEGSSYYFDVAVVATQPGDQYNIEVGEIISVTGLLGYTSVTNKVRGKGGLPEATAEQYVEQIRQSLGEQSMVTSPGVLRQIRSSLPEATRVALVGAGDPRMQRDLLQGGSYGPVQYAGTALGYLGDGEGRPTSRRVVIDTGVDTGVDFTTLQGPAPLVLTIYGTSVGGADRFREVEVASILTSSALELAESVMPIGAIGLSWSIRKREIKLLSVPGGVLAPDPNGQGTVAADQTHVGGMFDVYLRSTEMGTQSVFLSDIQDDEPLLSGTEATGTNPVGLNDITEGIDFLRGDPTWVALTEAVEKRWALQIIEGPGAGVYDLLAADVADGAAPLLYLYDSPPVPLTGVKWKLVDRLNMDLLDPRKTRVRGSDLQTVQGNAVVTTDSLVDFQEKGVEVGDVLRIQVDLTTEDYVVQEVLAPAFSQLRLDREVPRTARSAYSVFLPNNAGGLTAPVFRLNEVSVLDASGQPTGTVVPCATMIGAHVLSLTNPARGEKLEVPDGLLGIISNRLPSGASVSGKQLTLEVGDMGTYSVLFAGVNPLSVASIVAQINAAAGVTLAIELGSRFGIFPFNGTVKVVGSTVPANSALPALFGGMYYLTTQMVRSASFGATTFTEMTPPLSPLYDVVELRSGTQLEAFSVLAASPHSSSSNYPPPAGLSYPTCVVAGGDLFPAADVRLAIGARSLGLVRCTFLDPTTVEVDAQTTFTFRQDGYELIYQPDPGYSAALIPAAPYGSKPKDGSVVAGSNVFSCTLDFIKKRVRPGDVIEVDFKPLVGTVALADPVAGLAGLTLVVSFGQESTRTITFLNDDDSIPPTDVTRQGVADQINQALGVSAASVSPTLRLELYPEFLLLIKATGTANAALGFSAVADQSNRSGNARKYTVLSPSNTGATVSPAFSATETRMQFRVLRPGSQRVGTTQMSQQTSGGGLFYMDVEVVSKGTGDVYNLPADAALTPRAYRAEGYELTTSTPELGFSTEEQVGLVLSRVVHNVGTNDDAEEGTPLTGVGLSIQAQGSELVAQAQSLLASDQQRDICANPLARGLLPHIVYFDLRYTGGPLEADLETVLSTELKAWPPDEPFEASWISERTRQLGATSVSNPLTLFVAVFHPDRTITLEKSQDQVNIDGLAAFYPGNLRLTRSAI